MQNIENGVKEIQERADPAAGVIALSYLNILGVELIPGIIRDYQQEYPRIQFELTQGSLGDIDHHLEQGLSDIMITSRESVLNHHHWIATIRSRFQNTGFILDSAYEAEDLITVAGFVKSGLGMTANGCSNLIPKPSKPDDTPSRNKTASSGEPSFSFYPLTLPPKPRLVLSLICRHIHSSLL
ncbi:LysR substrate-binding domain-containing protein [Paenibacillus macerans]|uniref:LysR substrate-binding domain-containing protein n=1 Tax=Paenibacillus macerans TaxID=44252 RepID=UPI003D314CD9